MLSPENSYFLKKNVVCCRGGGEVRRVQKMAGIIGKNTSDRFYWHDDNFVC